MTSASAIKIYGICAVLLAGLIGFTGEARAQTSTENDVAETGGDQDASLNVDRGEMRLKLLVTLVENELEEARLAQSRLTVEAAGLDQERRVLLAGPVKGTRSEQRQRDVIDQRLAQIDKELVTVNARLPEIKNELADLKKRLGLPGELGVEFVANGIADDGNVQWLDSKRRVQEALVYLGGYDALIDGDFGPRTQEAVRVYQRTQSQQQTGDLTNEQETALLEEAAILRARYGVTMIKDPVAGYRISYPSGLLPNAEIIEPGDRRFSSADGQSELLITSNDGGGDAASELGAIFEDLVASNDVAYSRKRDDSFVVAASIEEGRLTYDTARLRGGRVIRARLSYPAALRDLWSPFAVIMFNTFETLPSGES
ncbi:MAG: peptidoglycan-binding domain-containing protein [Geminicoccaceae bacterium]